MPQLALRPTHAPVRAYYKALDQFGKLHFDNGGNIRGAFWRATLPYPHDVRVGVFPAI